MARRTKRPRVVWFPNDAFFAIDQAGLQHSTINRASEALVGTNVGDTQTIIAPVIRDVTQNPLTAGLTLSDVENSGYRLRRIVGKFWVYVNIGAAENASPGAAIVTAAFIILRTEDTTGLPQNPDEESYTPAIIENNDSPWIWRRSWIVADPHSVNAPPFGGQFTNTIVGGQFQQNTFGALTTPAGGVMDGPHIDAKTARIVGADERLFLVITATALNSKGAGQDTLNLDYVWDLRVLGSMRSTIGNRRNASR